MSFPPKTGTFRGPGCQRDTLTPCWLRPWWEPAWNPEDLSFRRGDTQWRIGSRHSATRAAPLALMTIQYRHSLPAPVVRTSASGWLYKHPWITHQNSNPSTSMTHIPCESKLRSVLSSVPRKLGGNLARSRVSCQGCPLI